MLDEPERLRRRPAETEEERRARRAEDARRYRQRKREGDPTLVTRPPRRPPAATPEERAERKREMGVAWARRRRAEDPVYVERRRQQWRESHARHGDEWAAHKREKRATDRAAARVVRNKQARSLRERRSARIAEYKIAQGCTDCGFNAHPAALDFDHRDPSAKTANVSVLVACASWPRIMAEIAKCDVVCANCHRIRTCEAQQWRMIDRAYRNPRRRKAVLRGLLAASRRGLAPTSLAEAS